MSKIITKVESKIYLELTEGEAKALAAICGYGPSEFINWFYRNMGRHYLKPYEMCVKTLFQKARSLDDAVKQVEKARENIKEIITL